MLNEKVSAKALTLPCQNKLFDVKYKINISNRVAFCKEIRRKEDTKWLYTMGEK